VELNALAGAELKRAVRLKNCCPLGSKMEKAPARAELRAVCERLWRAK
jgi:hypothetical protein